VFAITGNWIGMVKEKPNSTRIYDEEGFRRRAACICVRSELEKEVGDVR
jgi:diphosphoinositol-polyphosphate diphosphatase